MKEKKWDRARKELMEAEKRLGRLAVEDEFKNKALQYLAGDEDIREIMADRVKRKELLKEFAEYEKNVLKPHFERVVDRAKQRAAEITSQTQIEPTAIAPTAATVAPEVMAESPIKVAVWERGNLRDEWYLRPMGEEWALSRHTFKDGQLANAATTHTGTREKLEKVIANDPAIKMGQIVNEPVAADQIPWMTAPPLSEAARRFLQTLDWTPPAGQEGFFAVGGRPRLIPPREALAKAVLEEAEKGTDPVAVIRLVSKKYSLRPDELNRYLQDGVVPKGAEVMGETAKETAKEAVKEAAKEAAGNKVVKERLILEPERKLERPRSPEGQYVPGRAESVATGRKYALGGPKIYLSDTERVVDYLQRVEKEGDLPGYAPVFGKHSLETAARTFEHRLPEFKEWWHEISELRHLMIKEFKEDFLPKIQELEKRFPLLQRRKTSERIGAYLASLDEVGLKTLKAMKIEVPKLSPEELAVVDEVRKIFDSLYDRLQEARLAAGKAPFPYRDNYFTFIRKLGIWQELGYSPVEADIKHLEKAYQKFIHPRTTYFRWAKQRTGDIRPIELNVFAVLRNYGRSALEHIYLSPTIGKYRELLNNIVLPGGEKISLREEAPKTYAFLSSWLDHIAGKREIPADALDYSFNRLQKLAKGLSHNVSAAVLTFWPGTMLKQPAAIANTWIEIGPYYMTKGILDNLKPQMRQFAMEHSSKLLGRQFEASIQDMMAAITTSVPGKAGRAIEIAKKAKAGITSVGLKGMEILDLETARATWLGAYRQATEMLGMKGKEAYRYADSVLVKTQASAFPEDIAPFQRTGIGKAISTLQTFIINQWGFLTKDVLKLGKVRMDDKSAFGKVINLIASYALFNYLYEDVLGMPSPLPSPISTYRESKTELRKSTPEAIADATKELLSVVPIVGGGIKYGSSVFGPLAETVAAIPAGGTANIPLPEAFARLAGIPGAMVASRLLLQPEYKFTLKEALLGRKSREPRRPKGPFSYPAYSGYKGYTYLED
ncbi:MAG: hypothetical protein ABIK44_07280 [candidate division WOR-3 bacterium]